MHAICTQWRILFTVNYLHSSHHVVPYLAYVSIPPHIPNLRDNKTYDPISWVFRISRLTTIPANFRRSNRRNKTHTCFRTVSVGYKYTCNESSTTTAYLCGLPIFHSSQCSPFLSVVLHGVHILLFNSAWTTYAPLWENLFTRVSRFSGH